jgi:hypothetical protein
MATAEVEGTTPRQSVQSQMTGASGQLQAPMVDANGFRQYRAYNPGAAQSLQGIHEMPG